MIDRRRALMGVQGDPEFKYLRYWWSGEDPAVDGKIVDRMRSGINWTLRGSPQRIQNAWVFDSNAKYGSYANCTDFNFGHHFKIYLDADIYGANRSYFLDLASVTVAPKNIGFSCTLAENWKMLGNNSNPGLSGTSDPTLYNDITIPSGEMYYPEIITFEHRERNETKDKLIVSLNGATHEYIANISKVEYSNFYNNEATLSRGFNASYRQNMKMRNLKIYVYD